MSGIASIILDVVNNQNEEEREEKRGDEKEEEKEERCCTTVIRLFPMGLTILVGVMDLFAFVFVRFFAFSEPWRATLTFIYIFSSLATFAWCQVTNNDSHYLKTPIIHRAYSCCYDFLLCVHLAPLFVYYLAFPFNSQYLWIWTMIWSFAIGSTIILSPMRCLLYKYRSL